MNEESAPRCDKRGFRSQFRALLVLAKIQRKRNHYRRERRAYYCEECGSWHLTSKRSFEERGRL